MVASHGGKGSLIGNMLGGYHVDELIGRGAMGTVYLAHDPKLGRRVALKVLLGSLARTPSIVEQFQREAQAAAPLNHPAIVKVYAAGMDKGTPYIAMEFVDGEPLDDFLKRKKPLRWQHAFHIAGQVALALECAHENGVVHRDVKPSNIMLDRSGRVRLADFGIATARTGDSSGSHSPAILGTPQYMSPRTGLGFRGRAIQRSLLVRRDPLRDDCGTNPVPRRFRSLSRAKCLARRSPTPEHVESRCAR